MSWNFKHQGSASDFNVNFVHESAKTAVESDASAVKLIDAAVQAVVTLAQALFATGAEMVSAEAYGHSQDSSFIKVSKFWAPKVTTKTEKKGVLKVPVIVSKEGTEEKGSVTEVLEPVAA